jgi:hypothetical protein
MSPRHIYPAEFFEDQRSPLRPVKRTKPMGTKKTAKSVAHEKRVLSSGCILITLRHPESGGTA